ncbi:HAMP domain-containing histidine kinase [Candidatus Woesearchaeota archaeon]|jgi:signal transduction histidine kinase|nr:HAMP domain-containing histidine kinase [Candidatus Woesearchaeota archaeon]
MHGELLLEFLSNFVLAVRHFFGFLSSVEGLWFKNGIGLVIIGLFSYMVFFEYNKNRKTELKHLLIAFSLFAFQHLITFLFLFLYIFGHFEIDFVLFPLFNRLLGLIAFFLTGIAFIYPIIKELKEKTNKFIKNKVILVSSISIIFILFTASSLDLLGVGFTNFFTRTIFVCVDIVILGYFAYFTLIYSSKHTFNRNSISLAFICFLIAPLFEYIQIIFFNGYNPKLLVATTPFPFVGIVLLSLAVYTKLVNKAYLINKIKLSNQKLEYEKKVSKMKDEFVSVVSHELRTPLTSMKLYSSLMESGKFGRMNKKQKDAIGIIKNENDRLAKLINDILDLSKMEANQSKLDISKFDLFDIVDDGLYTTLVKKKKIKFENNVPKNFFVNADQDKIKQVFINLFSNSIKFTPKYGSIIIDARKLQNNKQWQFIISDNGAGMNKEKLNKIFDKFSQLNNHMTRKAGGFGLGLAIVKQIVDLHQGTIQVESDIDKGSCFILSFPTKIKRKKEKIKRKK